MTPTAEHDHSEPSDNPLDPGILLPRMGLGLLSVLVLAVLFELGVQIACRLSEGIWRLDLLAGFAKGVAWLIAKGILLVIGWMALSACGLLLAGIGTLMQALARGLRTILLTGKSVQRRTPTYRRESCMTRTPRVWTGSPIRGDPERFKQGIKVSKGSILGTPVNLRAPTREWHKQGSTQHPSE